MSLFIWDRSGKGRPSERNHNQTLRTDPSSVNLEKTVRTVLTTDWSGWKRTSPSFSPHTKPTGKPRRSSPRAALLRIPPSSRARRMCSSASAMMTFSPSTRRSLKERWVVDTVAVSDQRVGDATEIEQAIPVSVVARHAGDFEAEHDADVAERHLGGHACEPGTLGESGAGQTQVFVDDDHLLFGPTEFLCFLTQSILAHRGFAVVFDLGRGGLANVDEGGALDMVGLHLGQVIHDFPPDCGCLRTRGR